MRRRGAERVAHGELQLRRVSAPINRVRQSACTCLPFSGARVQVMKLYSHPMAGSVFSTITLGASFLLGAVALVKELNEELQKMRREQEADRQASVKAREDDLAAREADRQAAIKAREDDLAAREADRQAAIKAREDDLAARQAFLDTVLTLTADFKTRGRSEPR
jgi:hypothetical protein